ncbi:hypothetical protein D3C87_1259480 [compost metagenome]
MHEAVADSGVGRGKLSFDRLLRVQDGLEDAVGSEFALCAQVLEAGYSGLEFIGDRLSKYRSIFSKRLKFVTLQDARSKRLAKLKNTGCLFGCRCSARLECLGDNSRSARDLPFGLGDARRRPDQAGIQINIIFKRDARLVCPILQCVE